MGARLQLPLEARLPGLWCSHRKLLFEQQRTKTSGSLATCDPAPSSAGHVQPVAPYKYVISDFSVHLGYLEKFHVLFKRQLCSGRGNATHVVISGAPSRS